MHNLVITWYSILLSSVVFISVLEYTFSQNFDVNDQVKKSFDEYGYVIVRYKYIF